MRTTVLALLWLLVTAAHAAGIGVEDARHLLNRTGFDARLEQIDVYAKLSRVDAVERLLAGAQPVARGRAPEWINDWLAPRRFRQASDEERKLLQQELFRRGLELKNWWLTELLTTAWPSIRRTS